MMSLMKSRPFTAGSARHAPASRVLSPPRLRTEASVLMAVLLSLAVRTHEARADVVVEGRLVFRISGLAGYDQSLTVSTSRDRQCTESFGRVTFYVGDSVREERNRYIIRLDKGLVWTLGLADSSMTESKTVPPEAPGTKQAELPGYPDSVLKDLGEHAVIAGVLAEHYRIRIGRQEQEEAPSVLDLWIARGAPGEDELQAFEDRRDQAVRRYHPSMGWPRDPDPFTIARHLHGYPMRATISILIPDYMRGQLPGDSAKARTWGFDPGTGTLTEYAWEVLAFRQGTVPSETFEIPAGFKRRELRDLMTSPSETKKAEPTPKTTSDIHGPSRSPEWSPPLLSALELRRRLSALTHQLDSADLSERRSAGRSLGELGYQAEPVIPNLLGRLSDSDTGVRRSALEALGRIGADRPDVMDALTRLLRGDPSPLVRADAARSLGALRDPSASMALAAALEDPDPGVRSGAAAGLRDIGFADEAITKALIRSLGDSVEYVRGDAVSALRAVRTPEAQIAANAYDAETKSRDLEKKARATLPGLMKAARGPDPHGRRRALEGIEELGPAAESAVPFLVEAALADPDSDVWLWAPNVLRDIGPASRKGVPHLLAAAKNPDRNLRSRAVRCLAGMRLTDNDVTLALIEATGDTDTMIRYVASEGLEHPGRLHAGQLQDLLRAIGRCSDPIARNNLLGALDGVEGPIDLLTPLVRHPDWEVRQAAIWALEKRGDTSGSVVSELAASLRGENRPVSVIAAQALEELGSVAALETLRVFRGDSEAYGPIEDQARIRDAERRPGRTEIAIAVTHERFRPAKPTFGSSSDMGRSYERQEVLVYLCDIAARSVTKLAVLRAPWISKSGLDVSIRGWDGAAVYLELRGRRRNTWDPGELRAFFRVRASGPSDSVSWIPGTARRPPDSLAPQWNERNYMRVAIAGNDIQVMVEPSAPFESVFRLDSVRGMVAASAGAPSSR
jgi:HEAT repeat protein